MKVIDLLNKIANGEEVPTFRYLDRTLRYNKEEKCDDINDICYCRTGFGCNGLNDEVEIIEEDKKIEKIKNINIDYCIDGKLYEHLTKEEIALDIQTIRHKLDEIIDYINKEK